MPPLQLPVRLPGKTVQIAYAPNASPDWQDVCFLQDNGQVFHLWYRAGVGWVGPEELSAPA